jgi:hypothetical protein
LVFELRATTVRFADASIAECFGRDDGEFARGKTAIPLVVKCQDARTAILITCVDVLANPGHAQRLENSKILHQYAKEHCYSYLEPFTVPDLAAGDAKTQKNSGMVSQLLCWCLSNEKVISAWADGISWSFFTKEKIAAIVTTIERWNYQCSETLLLHVRAWIEDCTACPANIFMPVARLVAAKSVHGEWIILLALKAVAQIKALMRNSKTLDNLPDPVPAEVFNNAAHWLGLEQTTEWYQKLALALRNSQHLDEAITFFERAIALDLALVYKERGDFDQVIELEQQNLAILVNPDKKATADSNTSHRRDVAHSYTMLASAYQNSGNLRMALLYWK